MENTLTQEKTKSPLTLAAKVLAVIAAVLMILKGIFMEANGSFLSGLLIALLGIYLITIALKIHKGKGTDYGILMLLGCFTAVFLVTDFYPVLRSLSFGFESIIRLAVFALFTAAFILYAIYLKKGENKAIKIALTVVLAVGAVYFLIYPFLHYIVCQGYNWYSGEYSYLHIQNEPYREFHLKLFFNPFLTDRVMVKAPLVPEGYDLSMIITGIGEYAKGTPEYKFPLIQIIGNTLSLSGFFSWLAVSLMTIASLKGKIAKADEAAAAKTKKDVRSIFIAAVCVVIISFLISLVSCSGGGSGGSSNGICQFDGCNRKATSIGGNFCSYHSNALDNIWDVQN